MLADFTAVNLDGATDEELAIFGRVFSQLAAYAEYTRRARELRRLGDVDAALSFERAAEMHYRKLPLWAKW